MKQFYDFMNPSVNPDIEKEMDTACLKNIRMISLIGLVFEVLAAIAFSLPSGERLIVTRLSVSSV